MNAIPPASFQYSPGFYDYIEEGARRSAARLLPPLHRALAPASVLDVGCGRGLWLEAWLRLGVGDVLGLDGAYVEPARLAIPAGSFGSMDIARSFDLGRRWGLAQCLEVAEHIPTEHSRTLVQNLTRHSDLVVFSAALPGQGGHHHVNEQPLEFWRDLFAEEGYAAFDPVRPELHRDTAIDPWYRYNTLLYVREPTIPALPAAISRTRLAADRPVPRFASFGWALRCALLRPLPAILVTNLARIKNTAVAGLRR